MRRVAFWAALLGVTTAGGVASAAAPSPEWAKKDIKAGIIGTDTSHAIAFTGILHQHPEWRVRVVAAFPGGSPDNPSSWNRVKEYAESLKKQHNIEIVDTIEALCEKVDAVLLESVDGRPHLEQARPVFKARKPLFIDKPFTASLEDAREIIRLSKESGVPFFSCSCVRFQPEIMKFRTNPGVGKVTKVQGSSPMSIEPHHPDLFWYGIHGVEALYTVMGRGCVSVSRKTETFKYTAPVKTKEGDKEVTKQVERDGKFDITTGKWADGRIGVFRGAVSGPYMPLVKVWGTEGEAESKGGYDYSGLVKTIAMFFHTGETPIDPLETLEIVEFMIAAQRSKERGGAEVTLEELRK
mgnify:CR=1 FL=1